MIRRPLAPPPRICTTIGVLATVLRYVTTPEGAHHLVCQGESRFRVVEMVRETPYFAARVEQLAEPAAAGPEIEARFTLLKERALEALALLPQPPPELQRLIAGIESAGPLADLIASFMDAKPAEKQDILETLELKRAARQGHRSCSPIASRC